MFQGAGTTPTVLADMSAAFKHNARWPDMYAWAVIDFFDYQYSFGVDTVFRALDVALGMGAVILMVRLATGKREKLNFRMAMLMGLSFVMLFLTPHGRALYAGFSVIHNYLWLIVVTLGFGMVYLQRPKQNKAWLMILMLVFGVVFGLSSNLTPLAFLLTWALCLVVKAIRAKSVKSIGKDLRGWELCGIVGILVGMGIAYGFGPGVSGYVDSNYAVEYDYVSLGEVVAEPVSSVVRLAKHTVKNFGRVILPLGLAAAVLAVVKLLSDRKKENKWQLSGEDWTRWLILVSFMVIHVVLAVQITAPLRILLPAYIAGVVAVLILAKNWLNGLGQEIVMVGVLVGVLALVVVRTGLAVDYRAKSGEVLRKIREAETETVCVTEEEVRSRVLPGIYLGQEDMLAGWTMPVKVYDKDVVWCE